MFYKAMSIALVSVAVMSAAQAAERKDARKADAPDTLVCTYERSVGSHIPTRVCSTRAQRDEQARADQAAMQRLNRPAAQANSTAGR